MTANNIKAGQITAYTPVFRRKIRFRGDSTSNCDQKAILSKYAADNGFFQSCFLSLTTVYLVWTFENRPKF